MNHAVHNLVNFPMEKSKFSLNCSYVRNPYFLEKVMLKSHVDVQVIHKMIDGTSFCCSCNGDRAAVSGVFEAGPCSNNSDRSVSASARPAISGSNTTTCSPQCAPQIWILLLPLSSLTLRTTLLLLVLLSLSLSLDTRSPPPNSPLQMDTIWDRPSTIGSF